MTKKHPSSIIAALETKLVGSRWLFSFCVLMLTAASLWPIWAVRLLPMQDYPQHLFLSHIIATYDNPAFDWKMHYQVGLGLRPYMLWYFVMNNLAVFCDVETAGKMVFSLYIVLITALVFISGRLCPKGSSPWGALLLYPFAFHQMYFMGFSNYIVSVPILFLAALDLEKLSKGASFWRVVLHAFYLGVLFLNHPYTVLVYIGLASAASLCSLGNWKAIGRTLAPSIIVGALFAAWFVTQHGPSSAPGAEPWSITWWPIKDTITYFLLMFTGMRWTENPDWPMAGLWVFIAVVFCVSWVRNGKKAETLRWPLSLFLASLIGFLVLPFWLGYYAYFNLRLAPVTYFALALLLSRLKISTRGGIVVAACAALLVVLSIRTQAAVSREAEEVLPVLAKMQKNSLVLPLLFDSSSPALDTHYFYEIHGHEAEYYHVIVGGGANPGLFPNAMMPVQYRPGFSLDSPGDPAHFFWPQYGPYFFYFLSRGGPPEFYRDMATYIDLVTKYGRNYDYILTRKFPPEFGQQLAPYFDPVAASGSWVLFRNRALSKHP